MSASTKRKLVTAEVLTEFPLPEENQKIVKLLGGKGNNLHEVVDAVLLVQLDAALAETMAAELDGLGEYRWERLPGFTLRVLLDDDPQFA